MVLESPFFLKEARVASRRQWSVFAWLLVWQVICVLMPLLLMEWFQALPILPAAGRSVLQRMSLTNLGLLHSIVCIAAGGRMGRRVFQEEARQGTLESLRLVSLEPWRLVLQKLLFPLYGYLLVWLAAVPVYWMIALRGHFSPAELGPGALLAGVAGLVQLGAELLAPSEGWLRQQKEGKVLVTAPGLAPGTVLLPVLVFGMLMLVQTDWIGAVLGTRRSAARVLDLYGFWLGSDLLLSLMLVLYFLVVAAAALAAASPASRWATALARRTSLAVVVVFYYLWVGWLWSIVSLPFRIAWMAALPALLFGLPLLGRKQPDPRPRAEDPAAPREIEWLGRRWDNPVMVRDLRAWLRRSGIVRLTVRSLFQLVAGVLFLAGGTMLPPFRTTFALVFGTGPSWWVDLLTRGIAIATFFAPLFGWLAFANLGSRAQIGWQKEARLNTYGQLLETPLPSAALVAGRWTASSAAALSGLVPGALLLGAGLLRIAVTFRAALPAYATLDLYLGSLGLLMGAIFAGVPRKTPWIAGLAATVLLSGEVLLVFPMGAEVMNADSGRSILSPFLFAGLAVTPLNLALAFRIFRDSVAELERRRASEGSV